MIVDGVVTDDAIFTADSQFHEIRKYSLDGSLLARTGGRGEGPGEFTQLIALEEWGAGGVVAFDRGGRRLSFYSSGLKLISDIRVDRLFSDICAQGGRLFLQGPSNGGLVHEVDPSSGRLLRSFGSVPTPPELGVSSPLRRVATRALADAMLICEAAGDRMWLVHRNTPHITAFESGGSRAWELELQDFKGLGFDVTDAGGLAMVPVSDDGAQHVLGSATLIRPNTLLVQYGQVTRDERMPDEGPIDSWEIDLASGIAARAGQERPRLLGRGGGILVFASNTPYPQLRIVADSR